MWGRYGEYANKPRINHAPRYDYGAKAVFHTIKDWYRGMDVGEYGDDDEIEQIARSMSEARIMDADVKHSLTKQAKLNP